MNGINEGKMNIDDYNRHIQKHSTVTQPEFARPRFRHSIPTSTVTMFRLSLSGMISNRVPHNSCCCETDVLHPQYGFHSISHALCHFCCLVSMPSPPPPPLQVLMKVSTILTVAGSIIVTTTVFTVDVNSVPPLVGCIRKPTSDHVKMNHQEEKTALGVPDPVTLASQYSDGRRRLDASLDKLDVMIKNMDCHACMVSEVLVGKLGFGMGSRHRMSSKIGTFSSTVTEPLNSIVPQEAPPVTLVRYLRVAGDIRRLTPKNEVSMNSYNCDANNPYQIWNLRSLESTGTW